MLPGEEGKSAEAFRSERAPATPNKIIPNDLWAVHDLLLGGYSSFFMQRDTEGHLEVQSHAVELADMLPKLHPHEPCREQIGNAIAGLSDGRQRVEAAANASWSCLPHSFSEASFYTPLKKIMVPSEEPSKEAIDARMPLLKNRSLLGACEGSRWPRTCSFWASLHTMAYRADALQLGKPFIHAVFPLLAGGATMCGGCTEHFRALHQSVLSPAVMRDVGQTF